MAKGALSRMADIIRADVNDLVSRMEDPDKMVRQMIREMEETVDEATAAVAEAVANERLLERRIRERQAQATRWQEKAEQALAAGEEDLARRALEQKVAVTAEAGEMETALEEARKVTAELKQQVAQLKAKLTEANASRMAIVARCRAAQSRSQVPRTPLQVREEPFTRFERLCEEVARAEATAEVYEEMAGSEPALEEVFDKLEQKKRVDAELKALKQRLGLTEA